MRHFTRKSDRKRLAGSLGRFALIVITILGATVSEAGVISRDDVDQCNPRESVSGADTTGLHDSGNLPERRFRYSRRAGSSEVRVCNEGVIRNSDVVSVAFPDPHTSSHRTSYGAGSAGVSALGDTAARFRVDA